MDSSTTDNVVALRRVLIDNGYVTFPLLTGAKRNNIDNYLELFHSDPELIFKEAYSNESYLNTAISCRGLVVLDYDIDYQDLAQQARELAFKELGEVCLIRTRADSPRFALVYRHSGKNLIIKKIGFRTDREHCKEIQTLTNGHILAYGTHPSGAVLEWERSPADTPISDLETITAAQVLAYLDKMCLLIPCDFDHRNIGDKPESNGTYRKWKIEHIEKCFGLLPNDNDDRAEWLKIGMSAWAAADESELDHKEALDHWIDWSNKNTDYADQRVECGKAWESFHRNPPRDLTAGTLIHFVREAIGDDTWTPWADETSVVDDEPIDDSGLDDDQDALSSDKTTKSKDIRRGIKCIQGRRHEIVDYAERFLIEAGVPIYQRSGMLVTPKPEPQKDREGRTVNIIILAPVTLEGLLTEMTRVIRWKKPQKAKKETVWVTVDAPSEYGRAILASDRNWSFPRIVGILTTPTLRPDGSLLDTPGYDPATGYYLVDTGWGQINVKERPTKEDALVELERLHSLYTDMPFVGGLVEGTDHIWQNEPYDPSKPNISRSVIDSMLITPVVPLLIGKAPAHDIVAPDYGSGKSYADDLSYNLLTGMNCPVTNASVPDQELTKVLDAHAIKGTPFICLDNATHSTRNVRLSQIISQDMVEIRVLGLSKDLTIAYNPFVVINGNNVPPDRDMKRRVVICYLDAQMERPYLREFAVDNRKTIRANRGLFISAILTMVRAYMVVDKPDRVKRLASFEGWSDYVASMLVWLGEANPIVSVEAISDSDSEENNINDIMDEIERQLLQQEPSKPGPANGEVQVNLIQGLVFKVSELTNYANVSQNWYHTRGVKPELYLALSNVGKSNGNGILDTKSIGDWLRRINGQVHGSRRFRKIEKVGKSRASNLWVFERVPSGGHGKLINIRDCNPYQEAMNDPVENLEEHQKHQKERQEAIDNAESQTKH
jgi:putative DNA primase/helicase